MAATGRKIYCTLRQSYCTLVKGVLSFGAMDIALWGGKTSVRRRGPSAFRRNGPGLQGMRHMLSFASFTVFFITIKLTRRCVQGWRIPLISLHFPVFGRCRHRRIERRSPLRVVPPMLRRSSVTSSTGIVRSHSIFFQSMRPLVISAFQDRAIFLDVCGL
jgi:hypothetical protein